MIKKVSLYIQVGFYLFAGVNHFIDPEFYLDLIPDYLPAHDFINQLSGIIEIVFGIGLFFKGSRKFSALGIIVMLLAFIPSHVYFIQIGSCVEGGLCVSEWVGWLRLILIHPLLILWAWYHRN